MRPGPVSRGFKVFVVAAMLAVGMHAPAARAAGDVDSLLARSRDLLRNAEYDENIALLTSLLADSLLPVEARRESYLLLIKTHLYLRTHLSRQSQGATAAELNLRRARELTRECLQDPALHSTRPEPEVEFPPEMVQMFRFVRAEVLGGFRVTSLSPPGARVVLDGDTLMAQLPDSASAALEWHDLPVGVHQVLVLAPGHVTKRVQIEISPGSVIESAYALHKRRGPLWYTTRAAAVLAVGTVIYMAVRPDVETDLPGPPPPPAGPGR